MKFVIDTKSLADGLRISAVAMTGRDTLPILGNVKIEAEGDQITLSTTNLDIFVIQKVPAMVAKPGAVTIPFELFSRLVGRIDSSRITITQENNLIDFKAGEVSAKFETLPADEFPPPLKRSGDPVQCDASDILKPFAALSHAISSDPSRYNLMGINADKGEFVSTDGRRLAVFKGLELTKESSIIPDVFIRAVLKISPEGECEVFIGDGNITLISKDTEICAKLIEGVYPNWKQTVPTKNGKLFSCGRKELIGALRTCAIFSDRQTHALHLRGDGKEIEVSNDGTAKQVIMGTELAGQPSLKIRFNSDFMLDTLGVLEKDNVTISASDDGGPMVIKEGAFKSIIMPMRIA